MPRTSKIKWRNADTLELQRVVKNFNAKIARIEKKDPNMKMFLPDRITVKQLRQEIETRQDFNRILNRYRRFSRKGAEAPIITDKGVKTTKWEKREMRIAVQALNAKKKAIINRNKIDVKHGNVSAIETANLRPWKYEPDNIPPSEWSKYMKDVNKMLHESYYEKRDEQYKINYFQTLRNELGVLAEPIIDLIKDMNGRDLYEHFLQDSVLAIDFIYDPIELELKFEEIYNRWSDIVNA